MVPVSSPGVATRKGTRGRPVSQVRPARRRRVKQSAPKVERVGKFSSKSREWASLINRARATEKPKELVTLLRVLPTDSQPIHGLTACNTEVYVKVAFPRSVAVKLANGIDPPGSPGLFMRRVLANEHVVHRLGVLVGAPVPAHCLVDVTTDFLRANASSLFSVGYRATYEPGIAHGSISVPGLSSRLRFQYAHLGDNPRRFATIALLYGWAGIIADHQFFYKLAMPKEVYSLDHGFALGGISIWKRTELRRCRPTPVQLDEVVCSACPLKLHHFADSVRALRAVIARDIARVVASLPASWSIGHRDRIALAIYLSARKRHLLSMFSGRV